MGTTAIHNIPMNKIVGLEYRNQTVAIKINRCYNMNQQIGLIAKAGCWEGQRCFILGGGPSLKEFNFKLLEGELTIGINKAFEHCQTTINYSMDSSLYDRIVEGKLDDFAGFDVLARWKSFKGKKVFITPIIPKKFGNDVYVVKKVLEKVIYKDIDQGIYGGSNSGTGALSLAATLGAKTIYLLGYDMKAESRTHWHESYEARDLAHFRRKLEQYCKEITNFAPVLKEHNVNVVNLNRDSALGCFPFDDLGNVLGGS